MQEEPELIEPRRPTRTGQPGWFATTRWSLVLNAGQPDSEDSARALTSLCEAYWFPLYTYIRRRGYHSHDA